MLEAFLLLRRYVQWLGVAYPGWRDSGLARYTSNKRRASCRKGSGAREKAGIGFRVIISHFEAMTHSCGDAIGLH